MYLFYLDRLPRQNIAATVVLKIFYEMNVVSVIVINTKLNIESCY